MSETIFIATRESPLALWQAKHVQARLQSLHPQLRFELLGMTTRGDQILDRSLSKVGGKGLFVKELETALLAGKARIAVHSLKDVPMQLEPEFRIAAIMEREDPRDAVVFGRASPVRSLAQLPAGAKVGSSSLRRGLMLRTHFSQLQVVSVRGNVGTRLKKLDEGQMDALIMAAAGLKRLGLTERIDEILPWQRSLPAPGQGALALEICAADAQAAAWVAPLNDEITRCATEAERSISRALGGSCEVPLAAYAQIDGAQMHLRAIVGSADSGEYIEVEQTGEAAHSEALAQALVAQLLERGALALIGKT